MPGLAKNGGGRPDQDNVALLLGPRQAEKLPAAEKNRSQVGRQGVLPLRERHVGDRNVTFAPNAGIGHQSVHPPEPPAGLREQRAHLSLVAQIRTDDERLDGSKLGGQPLRHRPLGMIVQCQPRALRGKGPGHGSSQPARRPGDENDFACKFGVHGRCARSSAKRRVKDYAPDLNCLDPLQNGFTYTMTRAVMTSAMASQANAPASPRLR